MTWWRHVVAAEIRKILAFRADFWVTFIGQTVIQILIARALWASIFESSGNDVMEGFTLETMTLYYLLVPIGSKMLTGENIGFLSREIYDGTFSKYLLYPISFFQYKSLTYLTYSSFYGLQLIAIYFIYSFWQFGAITLESLAQLSLGIVLFLFASLAYSMLAMFVELIALWADNIWSLMVMTRFFCFFFGGAYVPLDFFPEWMKDILAYTPFPYLVNLPIKATMGMSSMNEIVLGIIMLMVWGSIFALATRFLWSKGQYRYSGVGI